MPPGITVARKTTPPPPGFASVSDLAKKAGYEMRHAREATMTRTPNKMARKHFALSPGLPAFHESQNTVARTARIDPTMMAFKRTVKNVLTPWIPQSQALTDSTHRLSARE